MLTSTAILGTIDRALRHPGWAYVHYWQYPPLLALRRPYADAPSDLPAVAQEDEGRA
jgi:hypothetical protein